MVEPDGFSGDIDHNSNDIPFIQKTLSSRIYQFCSVFYVVLGYTKGVRYIVEV